jgi:DNA-binding NarL/FixJ family response regulator
MPAQEEPGSDFISIVVADRTRIHTQLLAEALRNDRSLQVVAAVSSSEELLAAATRVPIDVAVIGHDLDDLRGQGTAVLRQMRALRPQVKGVILLDSAKADEVLACFRAGARGIFSRAERIETLWQCIRSVHEGQVWARSSDLDQALQALADQPMLRTASLRVTETLSAREREVVHHLAAGMTNREIAEVLGLSPHTVKNYLFKIFDKLGVSSRTELLYLMMNQPSLPPAKGREPADHPTITAAAEAGDPYAQLQLGNHFSRDLASLPPDPVKAYRWYLLAASAAGALVQKIERSKRALGMTMSPAQMAEAANQAAEWQSAHPLPNDSHSGRPILARKVTKTAEDAPG